MAGLPSRPRPASAIAARAVIIAAGAGAFGPNRPPLAGIAEFEGKSVFYLVRRREDFRGKRVVIAGGGDSAVDWALSLGRDRRAGPGRASPAQIPRRAAIGRAAAARLADEGRIDLVIPYQLHALEGDGGQLSAVIVADLAGNTRRLDADCLLPFFGLATDLGPLAAGGSTSSTTISASIRRPARPRAPASSRSATSRPIRASSS